MVKNANEIRINTNSFIILKGNLDANALMSKDDE